MCGRTACTLAPDDVRRACTYRDKKGRACKPDWRDAPNGNSYFPSYNVAPGSHTPVLLSSHHFSGPSNPCSSKSGPSSSSRVIQPMMWGLIPSWHKGGVGSKSYETNNCRAEGMLEKATYKVPLQKGRRCVILADGFYEWKRDKKNEKQPYYIYFPQNNPTENKTGTNANSELNESIKANANPELGQSVKTEIVDRLNKGPDETNVCSSNSVDVKIKTEVKKDPFDVKNEQSDIKKELIKVKQEPVEVKEEIVEVKENPAEVKQEPVVKNEQCKIKKEIVEVKQEQVEVKQEPVEVKNDTEDQENDLEDEWTGPRLLTMAGVFDVWTPSGETEPLYSYSVITVESSTTMAWLHHRMPAMLTTDAEIDEWLDSGRVPLTKAAKLIRPVTCLEIHPVSTIVNNSRNKSPDCVKRIDLDKTKGGSSFMMTWLAKGQKHNDEPPNKKTKFG